MFERFKEGRGPTPTPKSEYLRGRESERKPLLETIWTHVTPRFLPVIESRCQMSTERSLEIHNYRQGTVFLKLSTHSNTLQYMAQGRDPY